MNKNDNKKKKQPLISWLTVAAIFLASVASEGDEDAIYVILAIVIVGAIIAVMALAAKKKSGAKSSVHIPQSEKYHSHDRLHPEQAVRCTTGYEHWKQQIDGFLANGLIEREEHRYLLEKHRHDYD